ncbi:amino acid ABC transporter substrate-binding protein [Paraglaciecola sp. L1A13]|uniref:amino acid ABC transporter substrate-binding protein n=1 Tax=Paraglaciecola sp. L1A13 TaxID=2686359 RepID=UPI00131CD63F|nr:amino acid ABC transporter substrate-binding protein [Paraglaciecola sp. L1A13]
MKLLKQQQWQQFSLCVMTIFALATAPVVSAQMPNEEMADIPSIKKQTLDRVKETGVFRLGFRLDDRPFSYRDKAGNAAGYAIELCRKIVEETKAQLGIPELMIEEVPVTGEERFGAVNNGKIDLLCGAATETIARRKLVSFSIPIFASGISALTRVDAPKKFRALLAGEEPAFRPRWRASYAQILEQRTVSVIAGTSAEAWVKERIKEFAIIETIVEVADYKDGIDNVLKRSSDVMFGDRAILLDSVMRNPDSTDLIVIHRYFTHEPITLALKRGDEDFRLLVDSTLSDLYHSGQINEIYKPFFGQPDATAESLFTHSALPK